MMKLFGKKENPKIAEMERGMEDFGARANARLNEIDREPQEINHMAHTYERAFPELMNGETRDIYARLDFMDPYVQCLDVQFGRMAYSPAHTHPHYCVHHVKCGTIHDSIRDKRYDKGDWYLIEPGQVHSAQSVSGAHVTIFNTGDRETAYRILAERKYDRLDKVKIREV